MQGFDPLQMLTNIFEYKEAEGGSIVKIALKVAWMKFLAMHITNKKISFYIFAVGNLQNIFMEHDLWFLAWKKNQ